MDIKDSLKLAFHLLSLGHKGKLTPQEAEKYMKDYPILRVYAYIIIAIVVILTLVACFLYARYVKHLY
jgi:hypothetical protein